MNYRKTNLISGWLVFIVAAIVYLLTIPPTASFWDCGEFIATAYKLEVCHAPGAPLFMILARFFTMFASPTHAAMMVNAMSALASAFTILFLFWTISHLAKKIIIKNNEITNGKILAIVGAGFVGAFAYMFSDSFWFSAVEGEVYAMSSLFTALVFWAILKWENIADQPGANKWLIFIGYLIGLSIGVHLLNLLAIPAIVFVYYFRKYKTTPLGVVAASFISVGLLGIVMYIIIPYTVIIASWFDLLFVNGFGLPFNSGVLFFALILISALIYGIWRSYKKGNVLVNTILLGVTVIILGYSSYAMTVIRSAANPPMDQNDPDDLFSLLSYLNRDQYGDRPLVEGQYYSAPIVGSTVKTEYLKKDGKYVEVNKGIDYKYDKRFTTFFPRMYDSQDDHVKEYKRWGGPGGTTIQTSNGKTAFKPSFGANLKYFFRYQLGFMYGRYFMWNFVGRQNDIQGHGEASHGNWLSGIPFVDNARLGPQKDLPKVYKNHDARNVYFFLPLLLGLIGLLYHYSKHRKDFWVVMLLFIFTGIAIVVYLNQYPLQPRERDYAYVGSFYAFAIWIGIGVLAIYESLNRILKQTPAAIVATSVTLLAVPVLMGCQNWNDHDRSGRYTARDFAYDYLNTCQPNAILFTNGDNDTFPIWYIQEVEEVRNDVRIICIPYLSTDWYIDQMKRQAYKSSPVPFKMKHDDYVTGTRDMIFVQDQPNMFLNERYNASKKKFEPKMEALLSNLNSVLAKSNFPNKEQNTWEKLNDKNTSITPGQLYSLVIKLSKQDLIDQFNLNADKIKQVEKSVSTFIKSLGSAPVPIKVAMDFVASNNQSTKVRDYNGQMRNYLPARNLIIPVDKKKVLSNGTVPLKDSDKVVDNIVLHISNNVLVKGDMMTLDLLANFNWDRPIYFSSVGRGTFAGLKNYTQMDGFAYHLVPIKNTSGEIGGIDVDTLYNNMINKFMYRNLSNPDVHLGWTNRRTINVVRLRTSMARLAIGLVKEGEKEKAIKTVDKALEVLSPEKVQVDYFDSNILIPYYMAGAIKKGNALLKLVFNQTLDGLNYYLIDNETINNGYMQDQQLSVGLMQKMLRILQQYNQKDLLKECREKLDVMLSSKSNVANNIKNYNQNRKRLLKIFYSLNNKNIEGWYRSLSSKDKTFINSINNFSAYDSKIMQLYVSWIL